MLTLCVSFNSPGFTLTHRRPVVLQEKFQREFRLRLDVCLRRSPTGRGSISRELSNLDSGRWEWPGPGPGPGPRGLTVKNGDKHAGERHHDAVGSNSGLSVLTGNMALTP